MTQKKESLKARSQAESFYLSLWQLTQEKEELYKRLNKINIELNILNKKMNIKRK